MCLLTHLHSFIHAREESMQLTLVPPRYCDSPKVILGGPQIMLSYICSIHLQQWVHLDQLSEENAFLLHYFNYLYQEPGCSTYWPARGMFVMRSIFPIPRSNRWLYVQAPPPSLCSLSPATTVQPRTQSLEWLN